MKLKLAVFLMSTTLWAMPASAAGIGEGCDTRAGRDGGQQMCDAGLSCTGPFEGSFGHGNCQAVSGSSIGEGCDTLAGRPEGQQMCSAGLVCTGPFEGSYGHGNCQAG